LLYRVAFCNFGKDGRNKIYDFHYNSDDSDHNGSNIFPYVTLSMSYC